MPILYSCSKSSDQQEFEDRAFSTPENITEMTVTGEPVPGRTDPDDWRIAPMFRGFVEIQTPAHPNPVSINSSLQIDVNIIGIESVQGLAVFVFKDRRENLVGPIFLEDPSTISPGLISIILDPSQFSRTSNLQEALGLHRILIFDQRDNLISYGDVRVE